MTGKISSLAKMNSNPDADGWQTLVWDGLQLEVPGPWTILQLDRRFLGLGLAEVSGPLCEVRWQPRVGRRFNAKRVLRQLERGHSRALAKTITDWPLAADLSDPDKRAQLTGFTWQSGPHRGHGLIRYCQACQTVILLQLLDMNEDGALSLLSRLLVGVRDHHQTTGSRWRVFDVDCWVPLEFDLDRFGFHPGRFELAFKTRRQRIGFYRWAPADAILQNMTLLELAGQRWPAAADALMQPIPTEVVGRIDRSRHLGDRWRQRLKGEMAFQWYFLQHAGPQNRLLGIEAQGATPYTEVQLRRLADDFNVL